MWTGLIFLLLGVPAQGAVPADRAGVMPPSVRPRAAPRGASEVPARLRFDSPRPGVPVGDPVALYLLLRLAGRGPEFEAVRASLPGPPAGHSVADLRAAAAKFGVELETVRIPPGGWASAPRPSLVRPARGETGRFDVLLNCWPGTGYNVIDTSECRQKQVQDRATDPPFERDVLVIRRSSWRMTALQATLGLILVGNAVGIVLRARAYVPGRWRPRAPGLLGARGAGAGGAVSLGTP